MAKRLTPRKQRRLVREARGYFEDYPIDWSQFGEAEIEEDRHARASAVWASGYLDQSALKGSSTETPIVTVSWSHLTKKDVAIVLTSVWWNGTTGAILQAGSNYGFLSI